MMVKIKFVLRARVLAFPVGRLQLNSVVVVCIGLQFCISVEVSLNHVGLSKRESITKITPVTRRDVPSRLSFAVCCD